MGVAKNVLTNLKTVLKNRGADLDAIRTSYKRLANKWHPEKHPKSEEAFKLFQKISRAYRRLIEDNDRGPMDAKEMYSLYQQTVYSNDCHNGVMDNYSESDDGDSDSSYEAEDLGRKFRGYHSSKFSDDEDDNEHKSNGLTDEQRQKFANELISEEEKRKKKLEKRRLKKKQRREKKRLEKQTTEQIQIVKVPDMPKKNGKVKEEMQVVKESKELNSSKFDLSSKSDSEELNMNAAFYTQVTKKKKPASDIEINRSAEIRQPPIRNDEIGEAIIIQSRQFAIEGNTRANNGHFREAVDLFSKAVSLDSSDFRFFGNRSFCYERLEEFDKALADANRAISIAPDWPKGYFRKGKALVGLKNYTHAEDAFTHVLKLDMKCIDAKHELNEVRIQQLIEMGFTPQLARSAIQQHGTVPQALDSLLAGRVSEMSCDEVYISDVEDSPQSPQGAPPVIAQVTRLTNSTSSHAERPAVANNSHQKASSITTGSQLKAAPPTNSQKAPLPPIPQHHYEQAQHQILINKQMDNAKMNPRNPEGLTSLWVGNVLPDVSQEDLVGMFSKYGKLQSVKCLPDKFCAFVNFTSKECAGKAMEALQGIDCGGQKLLIKFPDNPLTSSVTNGTEKIVAKTTTKVAPPPPIAAVGNNKISGPVNGNECYFWRTTGCQFANSCRYRHVPDHKGIDKKPWHKSK